MKHRFLFFLTFFLFIRIGVSQSSHELLLEGDAYFKKEQYDLAEEKYRKAKAKDESGKAAYNLGNSLTVQERHEEAANQFSNAAEMSSDPEIKSKALYNLGNAQFRNQKFKESIDAYEKALSFNEEDQLIKENLMLAKYMLKQQEQQQQQQQQQQENQENQENQEDQQQNQQQEEQQQDQQQQENQENQQNQEEQQNQQEKEETQKTEDAAKKDLDKEDARKLLEIIDNEEKKVQEKLRKMKGNSKKPKKDW